MSELETKFYPVIGESEERPISGLEPEWLLRRRPQYGPRHVSGPRPASRLRSSLGACRLGPVLDDRPGLHRADRDHGRPFGDRGRGHQPRHAAQDQKGRIAWEQITGLEEYIRRAEVDDIQAQDRRGVFERLLPYAIIFGLIKPMGQSLRRAVHPAARLVPACSTRSITRRCGS